MRPSSRNIDGAIEAYKLAPEITDAEEYEKKEHLFNLPIKKDILQTYIIKQIEKDNCYENFDKQARILISVHMCYSKKNSKKLIKLIHPHLYKIINSSELNRLINLCQDDDISEVSKLLLNDIKADPKKIILVNQINPENLKIGDEVVITSRLYKNIKKDLESEIRNNSNFAKNIFDVTINNLQNNSHYHEIIKALAETNKEWGIELSKKAIKEKPGILSILCTVSDEVRDFIINDIMDTMFLDIKKNPSRKHYTAILFGETPETDQKINDLISNRILQKTEEEKLIDKNKADGYLKQIYCQIIDGEVSINLSDNLKELLFNEILPTKYTHVDDQTMYFINGLKLLKNEANRKKFSDWLRQFSTEGIEKLLKRSGNDFELHRTIAEILADRFSLEELIKLTNKYRNMTAFNFSYPDDFSSALEIQIIKKMNDSLNQPQSKFFIEVLNNCQNKKLTNQKFKNGVLKDYFENPTLTNMLQHIHEMEVKFNNQNMTTFIHGQRSRNGFLEELYNAIAKKLNNRIPDDYLYLRFLDLDDIKKDGKYKLIEFLKLKILMHGTSLVHRQSEQFFMNAFIEGGTNKGNNTLQYAYSSYNMQDMDGLTSEFILETLNISPVYTNFESELEVLQKEYIDLNNFGRILQIAVPNEIVNKIIYLSRAGGAKISFKNSKGEVLNNPLSLIKDVKANPSNYYKCAQELSNMEFAMVLTQNCALNPNSGIKVFMHNPSAYAPEGSQEATKYKQYKAKFNDLIKRIVNEAKELDAIKYPNNKEIKEIEQISSNFPN